MCCIRYVNALIVCRVGLYAERYRSVIRSVFRLYTSIGNRRILQMYAVYQYMLMHLGLYDVPLKLRLFISAVAFRPYSRVLIPTVLRLLTVFISVTPYTGML
jgi:hypothetical protein